MKECYLLNHVYIHSFRSIIKSTKKFLEGWGIWSPGMDLWWGIWTAFRPREGGIWTKIFQKFKCPKGCPWGGMLKLRFDWYIIYIYVIFSSHRTLQFNESWANKLTIKIQKLCAGWSQRTPNRYLSTRSRFGNATLSTCKARLLLCYNSILSSGEAC